MTRVISAIGTLVVVNVSDPGVVAGIRVTGGVARSVARSYRAEGAVTSCPSIHWDGIYMEAGICLLTISLKNASIFPYYGLVWAKEWTTNYWPHSKWMWLADLFI